MIHLREEHPDSEALLTTSAPSGSEPSFDTLLSTLIEMDFEYERECDRLRKVPDAGHLNTQALARLKAEHHKRRQPYIQKLAILQRHIASSLECSPR